MKNTITVKGHFGDKEVNRESFIDQWIAHAKQFNRLAGDPDQLADVELIVRMITKMAESEFDKTLARNHAEIVANLQDA